PRLAHRPGRPEMNRTLRKLVCTAAAWSRVADERSVPDPSARLPGGWIVPPAPRRLQVLAPAVDAARPARQLAPPDHRTDLSDAACRTPNMTPAAGAAS